MKGKTELYWLAFVVLLMFLVIGMAAGFRYIEAKLLPLILGITILALALVQSGRVLVSKAGKQETKADGGHGEAVKSAAEQQRRFAGALGWIVGFAVGVYLLGYLIAVPIFVLVYSRVHGQGWFSAAAYALLADLMTYGVFEFGLRVHLFEGVLFRLLS